jgi:hypothetical protein
MNFTCAECHRTFAEAWSDSEAAEELQETFGGQFEISDCARVCDDCYMALLGKIRVATSGSREKA